MSIMAVKFFARPASRTLRLAPHNLFRMSSTDEPCHPKKEPCPEPPKPECSPPSSPVPPCPEPPPCPPMPPCPSTICPPVPDPNNPCNYVPPCPDGETPDLTKLKKLQCKFQENNGIPVYLKGGKFDVFLYQSSLVLTIFCCIHAMYFSILLILK